MMSECCDEAGQSHRDQRLGGEDFVKLYVTGAGSFSYFQSVERA